MKLMLTEDLNQEKLKWLIEHVDEMIPYRMNMRMKPNHQYFLKACRPHDGIWSSI